MGDSITDGTLVEWQKEEGDFCKMDEVIAVMETDKVSVEIRAEAPGVLVKKLAAIDDTLKVGAPIMVMDPDATPPVEEVKPAAPKEEAVKAPASPSSPSTPPPPPPPSQSAPPKAPPPPPPAPVKKSGTRDERRVPMSRMREKAASHLKESQNTAASLTTFNEIDMSNIMGIRKKHQDAFVKAHGIKLGFMSVFMKAACVALQDQPVVNAVIDGKDILYRDYCDISVAVASPKGLVVPVIRNAEAMNCADIEKEIAHMAGKAKAGTLALEDMTGGTFTISNGGTFGSLMGTPIINMPQCAILGMHGIFERPVAVEGKVEIRPMMYVALTYDHRIIDGREAVLFLRKIKDCVEDPVRFVLDI